MLLQKKYSLLNYNSSLKNITFSLNEYNKTLNKLITDTKCESSIYYISIYNNILNDAVSKNIKKINSLKHQEYINLSTNITLDNAKKMSEIFNRLNVKNHILSDVITENEINLTSQVEAIPRYLSYAYSNNIEYSLEDEYQKSVIKEISDLGFKIIQTFFKNK